MFEQVVQADEGSRVSQLAGKDANLAPTKPGVLIDVLFHHLNDWPRRFHDPAAEDDDFRVKHADERDRRRRPYSDAAVAQIARDGVAGVPKLEDGAIIQ